MKDFIGHPSYVNACKAASENRPSIPAWDVQACNIEDWKHKSAMQEGFDLCLAIFAPHLIK